MLVRVLTVGRYKQGYERLTRLQEETAETTGDSDIVETFN